MNRVQKTLTIALCMVFALAVASYAQTSGKIAVVNSQKAFEMSIEGKKAATQMQERETKIRTDIQKLDDSLRALESKINTGRLTMTQEALRALQADYDKKTTERKRYEEDAGKDNQQFQYSIIARVRNEMITVIEQIRKEKNFDLVIDLNASGIITIDPTIDITDEVVRRYDAAKVAAGSKR